MKRFILIFFLFFQSMGNLFSMESGNPTPLKRPLVEGEASADKRQKIDQEPAALAYPSVVLNEKIEDVIRDILIREEGKIWAAYYMVTSENLVKWWSIRKYSQEFTRAKKEHDVDAILRLEQHRTSPKEDILIVDRTQQIQEKILAQLFDAGIKVLIRDKLRVPSNGMQSMHHKFMIVYDKNGQGKFVVNGSWNMTNQTKFNWENIVIINDRGTIEKFIAEHEDLRHYCSPFVPQLEQPQAQGSVVQSPTKNVQVAPPAMNPANSVAPYVPSFQQPSFSQFKMMPLPPKNPNPSPYQPTPVQQPKNMNPPAPVYNSGNNIPGYRANDQSEQNNLAQAVEAYNYLTRSNQW